VNLSELFERSAVGELSAPSAPIRGHIGGALDARPGQCSDPGAEGHSHRSRPRSDGYLIKPASNLDQGAEEGASRSHRFTPSDLRLAPLFTPKRFHQVPHLPRAKQDPATPRVRASLETTGGYECRS
jgi:hypothetical protein